MSVNGRIICDERASLGGKTFVGLDVVKEADRFFDPAPYLPEMIPVIEDLERSVRSAHSA